jgi:hypothetical protein
VSFDRLALVILAPLLTQVSVYAGAKEANAGATAFRLSLDPNGQLTKCEITLSSGDAQSDDRVCHFMATRARFQPYLEEGKRIASVFTSRMRFEDGGTQGITFRKIDGAAISDRQVDTIVGTTKLLAVDDVRFLKAHVLIEPNGKVEKCAIINSSGEGRIDDLACSALRSNSVQPAVDAQNNPVQSVWDMKILVRGFAAK